MKTRFALSMMAATGLAMAQNSDLGLLYGISGPAGQTTIVDNTSTVSGSVAPSLQLNYARQVVARSVDLYVEAPLVLVMRESGTVISSPTFNSVSGSSGPDVFFTPGLRAKFSPQSRVSFYGAAGVGVASFTGVSIVSSGTVSVSSKRQNSFAFGLGGGLDFRLTRLLSLRIDARDFITQAGLGGSTGRNHGMLQFGIAFHF